MARISKLGVQPVQMHDVITKMWPYDMSSDEGTTPENCPANSACLLRVVTQAMKAEPMLEAVKVIKGRPSISLATLGATQQSDLERTLAERFGQIESTKAGPQCRLFDGKADCTGCPASLSPAERRRITVQQNSQSITIARVTCPTSPRFWHWREMPLPKLVPREILLPDQGEHEGEWKLQLLAAGMCGLLGLVGYALSDHWLGVVFYILAYLAGAWFTAEEVWERLQKRMIDVHFLMLAVALGSASVGAWAEGAMLLFLFSLSGALEHYALGRTQREIRALFKTAPKVATVLDEAGQEQVLPVEQLRAGMRLLIKPGDQFPVDAEIMKGKTASDESNLTGEAAPVEKGIGDVVLAGTMNQWGVVEVTVLRPVSQSSLQKIIELIKEAQHLKAPSQRFTDKFGTRYTYGILGLSIAMFFIWWLAFGAPPFISTPASKSAFYRAMTLLVVASPCALVLSIPSAVLAAIAWSARRGILFRGGAAVEKLAEVSVVAMDKTGTLTTGELQVDHVESFPPGREIEVAQLAYSLERLSTHPLARAITRYGKQQRLSPLEVEQVESITGFGLQARQTNTLVTLGRRDWFEGALSGRIAAVPPTAAGFSEAWLAKGDLLGRILLRDDIRPQAREVVAKLRALGLQTIVLTGDRQAAAEGLKQLLRVDDVRAELKPERKVEAIRSFTLQNQKVAMIGDGVNDAPSLAASYVGVAMGARGSDAALEQAEVVLMNDRLENFLTAFQLSRRARRIIQQNLVISLGTVAILVSLALFEGIPLTLGVVGHEGSTVVVVLNSLRLLFGKSLMKEKHE